ncbi:MAG: hypothetical protein JWN01_233 [Patescibacteria group bacterium]|nr:hypothetical protein [Patescibacteria group bacterium]
MLPLGRKEHLAHIQNVRVSHVLDESIMAYTIEHEGRPELRIAIRDPDDEIDIWNVPSFNHHLTGAGMVVPEYLHNGQHVLYYGERELHVAFSKNLVAWHNTGHAVAAPRKDRFDAHTLQVVTTAHVEQGIVVLYETRETKHKQTTVSIGVLLCAADNPEHVLWRSDEPLHQFSTAERDQPRSLGAVVSDHEIVVYLTSNTEKLITLRLPNPFAVRARGRRRTQLHRSMHNPIMEPSAYEWESEAVFNPAAFVSDGRVHLLYRAMGPDGVSRIGYASSADGIHFDDRLSHPVYTPSHGIGTPDPGHIRPEQGYNLAEHPSGGGWAGCEDPRAVVLDGHAYMSFTAFCGWDNMRIALTSISLENIKLKKWNWRKSVMISRPKETNKNWVIFPEKVNGKYAILHGLSPKIHIEYVDSLDALDGKTFIDSLPPAHGGGYGDPRRKDHWDSRVRGTGAPPIKTAMGWLLFYHANDKFDPGKYKLGAMLLDLDDPTKILYRTNAPILEPKEWYENDGKPGVVYTCGAVVLGENLIVYYGGGDKRVAAARANVDAFLDALVKDHALVLTSAGDVA